MAARNERRWWISGSSWPSGPLLNSLFLASNHRGAPPSPERHGDYGAQPLSRLDLGGLGRGVGLGLHGLAGGAKRDRRRRRATSLPDMWRVDQRARAALSLLQSPLAGLRTAGSARSV